MMDQRQTFFDEITGFTKQMAGDPNDKSLEPWGELADAGKLQIIPSAEAFASVAAPHMLLLANGSRLPLITSDAPVAYHQIHVDELRAWGIPDEWMYPGLLESDRRFFVLCPLTPRIAYLTSHFFPPTGDSCWASTNQEPRIFALNEVTRMHANRELYAPSARPYGPLLEAAYQVDAWRRETAAAQESGIQIYTSEKRYWISVTSGGHAPSSHPLLTRVRFCTEDLVTLHAASGADRLQEVTFRQGHGTEIHMKGARFVQVAITNEGESVIESALD